MIGARAVCVFCSASTHIDHRYLTLASQVGHELGRQGFDVVSGGGSISSMGALAVAARQAGARTVGVIPESLLQYEVGDQDADELIVTTSMRDRKAIMDDRSDAFLILPGGIGTMEEFFEAWVGHALGFHAKPVVVLDPWDDYRHLRMFVGHLRDNRFVSDDMLAVISWTQTVEEAIGALSVDTVRRPSVAEGIEIELESD